MKGKIFALVLSLALTIALTGCKADKDTAGSPETRMSNAHTSLADRNRGRYFADKTGDVRHDRTDWLGDDVRRATDKMMDSARNMGNKMGRTIKDMTH